LNHSLRLVCREFVMLSRRPGLFTDAFAAIDGRKFKCRFSKRDFSSAFPGAPSNRSARYQSAGVLRV